MRCRGCGEVFENCGCRENPETTEKIRIPVVSMTLTEEKVKSGSGLFAKTEKVYKATVELNDGTTRTMNLSQSQYIKLKLASAFGVRQGSLGTWVDDEKDEVRVHLKLKPKVPEENSTRCQVAIYDAFDTKKPGVLLYHHSDGYPDFMLPLLEKFLHKTYEVLKNAGYPYWWDSERVGAVMIWLSSEDYSEPLLPNSTNRLDHYESGKDTPYRPNGGVPVFQPTTIMHDDIEYLYKVYLKEKDGEFEIKVKKV